MKRVYFEFYNTIQLCGKGGACVTMTSFTEVFLYIFSANVNYELEIGLI